MKRRVVPEQLPQHVFPVHPWRLVEADFDRDLLPLTETLFNTGNGYLGLRGDHDEGRDAFDPGAFVNGFHETWNIHHAEEAFGFATTGQTIVNVPDAKVISLSVDDEPFDIAIADLDGYERVLDMRRGTLSREVVWRTAAGKAIRVRSQRLVSLVHRHIAAVSFEVTMLRGSAPVVLASRIVNRQDAEYDRRSGPSPEAGESGRSQRDPRRRRTFDHRVLQPRLHTADDRQITLGYQCTNSEMSLACAVRHQIECSSAFDCEVEVSPSEGSAIISSQLDVGQSLHVTKFISYHTSRYSPRLGPDVVDDAFELATRCSRSLDRVEHEGFDALVSAQEAWLDEFWANSDVEIKGRTESASGTGRTESASGTGRTESASGTGRTESASGTGRTESADGAGRTAAADQQAMRWGLYQLAQASAQTGEQGIAAKGVSGGGYEGHYFWDTEMYIVPFLSYTRPEAARQVLRFRWQMLPIARQRATALNQAGALYPWRTINGEEASAYYAAGTAQYHINADIALALKRYVDASGDIAFIAGDGAEILMETARLWADLGFFSIRNGSPRNGNGRNGSGRGKDGNGNSAEPMFHIHGVTGPDEYTAVVNDNLYTNVMARFNMRYAARVLELLGDYAPDAYDAVVRRVELREGEPEAWIEAAERMYLPYDSDLGIHPQDSDFLDREPWDFEHTPPEKYPLLLNFHPLVIYRHQVLKQADVVLAMSLRNDQFSVDVRRRNFEYYDPITTGDSSLSACVQAMAAAQIGFDDLAVRYFREALFVDLADLHGNTRDGVHVASAGGVWGTVVFGFAGLFETGTAISFDPHLPKASPAMTFRVQRHGSRMIVDLDHDGCTVTVVSGHGVPIHTQPGVTGLSPEPEDEGGAEHAALPARPGEAGDPTDHTDRVVLLTEGQSLRIESSSTP